MDRATRHQHRNAQRRPQKLAVHQCPSHSELEYWLTHGYGKRKLLVFPQQKLQTECLKRLAERGLTLDVLVFQQPARLGPSCWKMRSMRARSKFNSTIYKGSFNFGNLWQFWHFWQS